ncbi:hypothetical protein Tco_1508244 [Tanacetum coccineum]
MDGVDIENLTIEQYLELIKENHAPSVGIKVDDITIAEYLEYEETIKTQDYDDYQPHLAKDDVPTRYKGHLSPRHKSPDPPLDAKTNPYFQASLSPIHPKITQTPSKHTRGINIETVVYADSDHPGDYVDRKSTSGICTFMGCCLKSWFSKKLTALTISTTKAVYVSAKKACQQALWMKQALIDYDIRLDDVPLRKDISLSKKYRPSTISPIFLLNP